MSHVATVEIKIKDLKCLEAACKTIGLKFNKDQKTYKWYGAWMNDYAAADAAYKALDMKPSDYGKCTHAISVPGNKQAYEIGVVEQKDGDYALVWDFWQGGHGLEALAGKNCQNLVQAYAVEVAKKQLKNKGYSLGTTKTLNNGTIELVFNQY